MHKHILIVFNANKLNSMTKQSSSKNITLDKQTKILQGKPGKVN
jgi:hypothetical protein